MLLGIYNKVMITMFSQPIPIRYKAIPSEARNLSSILHAVKCIRKSTLYYFGSSDLNATLLFSLNKK